MLKLYMFTLKGEKMESILEIKNVTKIFGKKQKQALEMVKQGRAKTDILEKTGCTVGVYDASFEVKQGEIFVIMGVYLVAENRPSFA